MKRDASNYALPLPELEQEDPAYLSNQLITYIGNKRSLIPQIEEALQTVRDKVGRPINFLDVFSGSGVVSRVAKRYSSIVISNDFEKYAEVVSRCYLRNREECDLDRVKLEVAELNARVDSEQFEPGFIERLYSPEDDENIRLGERVFYTRENARRLDHYAQLVHGLDSEVRDMVLGPLLSAASVHANTAGVFKGFYKDKNTGIGRFGGSGEDALLRIKGRIKLQAPVLSNYSAKSAVYRMDANELVSQLEPVDLAYIDPPYNQHPYGSNYFMLNLLAEYKEPGEISQVSGIPVDWNRSGYNVRRTAPALLFDLVKRCDARFLLISFNDEGFVSPSEMSETLASIGDVSEVRVKYNTFRGSRNLSGRSTHVTEHLYLVERR